MEKTLELKQFLIETLSFIAKNFFLLLLFSGVLFSASFLSFKYAFKHQGGMLCFYGVFCYFFYYVFVNMYYAQKPIFTSEKIVNSVIKMLVIFALSLAMLIACDLGLKLLKNMAHWLVGFPDIYGFLKDTYLFLKGSVTGQFLIYVPLIFFLTFTFFIPAFSWISSINGNDASVLGAYAKVSGNCLKMFFCLFCLFGLLPFLVNFATSQTPVSLSAAHTFSSMIQLVFYLKLYDFFYDE